MMADRKKPTLQSDENGATIVEFALVAPVLMFMMMGVFDIGYGVYMRSVLDGAVQKAARDAAIQGGSLTAIDDGVEQMVKKLNKNAVVSFDRQSYFQFSDVDRAESFTDSNGDGECNNNEPFGDENDNDTWDADVGLDGNGGPKDVVYYTVSVGYNQLFPFTSFLRQGEAKKIVGYKNASRPIYRRAPAGYNTVMQPVYGTSSVGNKEVKLPIYKVSAGEMVERQLPEYKYTKVKARNGGTRRVPIYATSGGVERTVRLPIYNWEKVATGKAARKVPIYKLEGGALKTVRVPVFKNETVGGSATEVQVPQYRLTPVTRNIVNNKVEMASVQVPVYRNVTYFENGKEKLRREFVRNVTVKRPKMETITKVTSGTKTFFRRELVGYKAVKRSDLKLKRELTGYENVTRMVGQKRVLAGYVDVPRAAFTVKRTLVGYKDVRKVVRLNRTLLGYETITRPEFITKRELIGYKVVQIPKAGKRTLYGYQTVTIAKQERVLLGQVAVKKPYGFKKELVRTETYREPIYEKKAYALAINGLRPDRVMNSSTVMRNQPYGDQTDVATVTLQCT